MVNDNLFWLIKIIEWKLLFPDLENVKAKFKGEPVADEAGAGVFLFTGPKTLRGFQERGPWTFVSAKY